jgi:Predicted membrane protein (DUF2232)
MAAPVVETPTQRPRSWGLLLLALALFLFVLPDLWFWVPIEQTALVLVPVIAACAVVGWLAGAKPWLAIAWVALAIWFLIVPVGTAGSPYDRMARGWALLLAGSFGLMSLWSSAAPFIVRALGAIGLAIGTAFIVAIFTPGGAARFERAATLEFTRRSNEAALQVRAASKQWHDLTGKSPVFDSLANEAESQLRQGAVGSPAIVPALVALESLAALALGWALYHRLSGARIGPALSRLREFRFSDQLIWGFAVGATLLMLPPFQEGRTAGLNLLIFFGALYFLRGMGVLAWMSRRRVLTVLGLTSAVLLFALYAAGPVSVAAELFVLLVATTVIGLGDTWLDWRRRASAG